MAFGPVVELSSLNGRNGFQINGERTGDQAGGSVASAGDINGDGFDDLIVGAASADNSNGAAYVVFGKGGGFGPDLNVSTLSGSNGFMISSSLRGLVGGDVADAGDVNGDGFEDVIVSHRYDRVYDNSRVEAAVLFGRAGSFEAELDISALDVSDGFNIERETDQRFGRSEVAAAGDVNGDGIDDFILGVDLAGPNGSYSGASYVVFGRESEIGSRFSLSDLNGRNGFQISGERNLDYSGSSVSSAGDINGDGFDDLLVGARGADPNGADSGASYVVFGRARGFATELELSALNGRNGFQISGENAGDFSGGAVASAGDINGDGFDDLFVGAVFADSNGSGSGSAYVVFGKAGRFGAEINLSDLDGRSGFRISGETEGDGLGISVASAGDVNGDGFDDLIVGAYRANPYQAGASYVVFGRATGFVSDLDVTTLDGTNGFRIDGEGAYDLAGRSVSSAGDVNGDGFGDLLVGAPSPNGEGAGAAYVIFGQATGPLRRNGTQADDLLRGAEFNDTLSGAGGDDRLVGNAGDDRLFGGAGRDRLLGGSGGDELLGGVGADSLVGGGGDDRLVGGFGPDTLSGGAGIDLFVFRRVAESPPAGPDRVEDFATGADLLSLRPIDADPDLAGNQAFNFLGRGAFTGAGGEVRFGFVDGDTWVLADRDGDGRADLQVVLEGTVRLTADDILL